MKKLSILLILISTLRCAGSSPETIERATRYSGGESTPLQAIIGIAGADQVPLGIIVGLRGELCEKQQHFVFSGMTTYQALQKAVDGLGFVVSRSDGVYLIQDQNLTRREQEVVGFRFKEFSSPPATMANLGARLSGYISDVIEGTGSFLANNLGSPDDQIITIPPLLNQTAPQIANAIVKQGAKGMWIMSATRCDTGPKPGSTLLNIYSYHDMATNRYEIACPPRLVCDAKP